MNVLDFEEKDHSGINKSFLVPNQEVFSNSLC